MLNTPQLSEQLSEMLGDVKGPKLDAQADYTNGLTNNQWDDLVRWIPLWKKKFEIFRRAVVGWC